MIYNIPGITWKNPWDYTGFPAHRQYLVPCLESLPIERQQDTVEKNRYWTKCLSLHLASLLTIWV